MRIEEIQPSVRVPDMFEESLKDYLMAPHSSIGKELHAKHVSDSLYLRYPELFAVFGVHIAVFEHFYKTANTTKEHMDKEFQYELIQSAQVAIADIVADPKSSYLQPSFNNYGDYMRDIRRGFRLMLNQLDQHGMVFKGLPKDLLEISRNSIRRWQDQYAPGYFPLTRPDNMESYSNIDSSIREHFEKRYAPQDATSENSVSAK